MKTIKINNPKHWIMLFSLFVVAMIVIFLFYLEIKYLYYGYIKGVNITNIIRLEAFFNGTTYFLVWLEYFWYIFVGVLIFIILFILSIIELATRVMVINEDYTFYLKNAITKRKKLIKMSDIIIVDNSPLKIKWPTSNIFGKQLFVSFIIDQTDEKEFIAILNDSKKPQEPVTNENI